MTVEKIRQVVLDTETTGLSPQDGHRIIEIGCVELINRRLTNNTFHVYINPNRLIDDGAIEVHGITNEFLEDKPLFEDIVDDYLAFTRGAELIIHNAPFDVGFLNNELSLLKQNKGQLEDYSTVFDTLPFARKKYPGARASLDALYKRLCGDLELSDRGKEGSHGAKDDAWMLAHVYLAMTGGQFSLLDVDESEAEKKQEIIRLSSDRPRLKVVSCTEKELEAHQKRLEEITRESGECVWNK